MDLYLFKLINQFAFKRFWLDILGKFFAQYLGYVLIIFLFLFLFLSFKKYWKMVVGAIASAVLARLVIVEIIRWLLPRQRPFIANNNVNLLLNHSASSSFPSGHAAFFFAISVVVYFYNKKAGILFLIGAFLICLARVFVGVHWPSDVTAGALAGIFSGWLVFKIFNKSKQS
jgi:undecaprenyl-diphosphatase